MKHTNVNVKLHRVIILITGASIQLIIGIPAAWGAFQKGIEEGFCLKTENVLWLFSTVIFSYGVGCVVGGALQDKIGAGAACLIGAIGIGGGFWIGSLDPKSSFWTMLVGFSIPVGAGCAFIAPSVMSCAQKWWSRHRGFATGIIGCGTGLSGAVLTVSARRLIEAGGIRLCFRVIGSAGAVLCLLGAVVLREPDNENGKNSVIFGEMKSNRPVEDDEAVYNILRRADYWWLLLSVIAAAPTVLLFSPIIIVIGTQRGLSENKAAWAIIIGSFTSTFGRLGLPWLSDKIGLKRTAQYIFAALTGLSVLFAFAYGNWVIVVYCGLTLFYSGQAALLPIFASKRFGLRHSGINYGLLALGMSIGSLSVPILARYLQGNGISHLIAVCSGALGFAAICFYRGKKIPGNG